MRYGKSIHLEPCTPFTEEGKVYTMRMPAEEYDMAVESLFEARFGGPDPADPKQALLRRYLKAFPILDDGYCYLEAVPDWFEFLDLSVTPSETGD